MSQFLFDRLPIELIHSIFNYLLANDIFYALFNLSPYLDFIITNYDRYYLNFKSCRKSQFDFVCRHIRPDQVVSLTLSDANDTPDQSKLFFSYFKDIEHFVQLRSLRIIQIDKNSLKPLCIGLSQLKLLSSLEFTQVHSVSEQFNNVIVQLFPQLNRLILYDARHLTANTTTTHPFSRLRHLTLGECWFVHLQRISHLAPNLTSLDINVQESTTWPVLNYDQIPPQSLIRLILNIETKGNDDLCDSLRWQMLVSHLKIFNFKFKLFLQLSNDKQQELLSSFSNPFWIVEKHWFIVCNQYEIYSVPRFAETSACESFLPPIYRTVSNERLFYDHIFTLVLNKIDEQQLLADHHRFPHVRVLLLAKHLSLDTLRSLVDLSQVQYLKASLETFVQLADNMPRLRELALSSLSLNGLKTSGYEQIRILHLDKINFIGKNDEKRLFHMFTRVERFYVHGEMQSRRQMARFINGFHFLSYGSFEFEWLTTVRFVFAYGSKLIRT
ncbi:unnamed protein product [Rotaria sordida]|uniref:F-box domain-containing protein n=1 Tax=Rotaria sordida TaxID=392033 RepID=A0A815E865_9BILA|nr:unnamed protein product [Rotaria sordida]